MLVEDLEIEKPRPPARGIFYTSPPVLDEDDNIIIGGMWESQRLWWDLPNFVRMFVAGYGAGKSMTLCKRHIELALTNGPIPTALVSPTYSVAKETVVASIVELLEAQIPIQREWGMELSYTQWKSPPFEFEIIHQGRDQWNNLCKPRKGRIIIYSGEDPQKLKGPNLSSAGIDEPFIQDVEVFEQMIARVRHKRAKRLEVNLTGTPEYLGWGYDLAEGEMKEKYDVGIVQASTMENKALSKGYVQRLLNSLDPKAAQAYVHGMFVNLSKGMVYYAFDRQENVIDMPIPTDAELGAGMDFNVNPMASSVFWLRRGRNPHIHFFDEIELPNSNTPDMCQLLRENYWHLGLRDIYPDASGRNRHSSSPAGKSDYAQIQEAGFRINARYAGNPTPRDRYNAVNGMLRPYGGRVRMTIAPNCKRMIKYMLLYSHEYMHRDTQAAFSHLLDSVSYPVAYIFPVDRENLRLTKIRGV